MKITFSKIGGRLLYGLTLLIIIVAAYFWRQNNDLKNYNFQIGESAEQRLESYTWHHAKHQIRLVDEPRDAYLTRRQLIKEANERIDIATFLWRDDISSRVLFDDLLDACERGVKVRLLSDGVFFLRKLGRVKAMAQAHENLEIRLYNPLGKQLSSINLNSLDNLGWSLDNANHRFHIKLFTVDGEQCLLGGRNIGDPYFGYADDYNFIDTDVLIKGPATQQAGDIFQNYWTNQLTVDVLKLSDVAEAMPEPKSAPDPLPRRFTEGTIGEDWRQVDKVAIWADHPTTIDNIVGYQPGLLADRLADLAGSAQNELLVATPYLVLSERSHAMLRQLRESNKDLKLHFLSNSLASSDNWQTYSSFQAQLQWMLADYRLHIHLKKPFSLQDWAGSDEGVVSCLHSKVWVVDERWSAIGSFNWDPRSEIFNSEVMAVFDDPELAKELRQRLQPLTHHENTWVVAERDLPIGLEQIDDLSNLFNQLSTELIGLRTWSLSNTALYEYVGEQEVSPFDKTFHENFKSVGSFPEVNTTEKKRVYSLLLEPLSDLIKPAL